jgi:hypothetical protein
MCRGGIVIGMWQVRKLRKDDLWNVHGRTQSPVAWCLESCEQRPGKRKPITRIII